MVLYRYRFISLFVIPLFHLDLFVFQRFFMKFKRAVTFVLPNGYVLVILVVSQAFSFRSLIFFPEMTAAAFVAVQGILTILEAF